jgi:uncharacterized protein YeaO (DUF488 family)
MALHVPVEPPMLEPPPTLPPPVPLVPPVPAPAVPTPPVAEPAVPAPEVAALPPVAVAPRPAALVPPASALDAPAAATFPPVATVPVPAIASAPASPMLAPAPAGAGGALLSFALHDQPDAQIDSTSTAGKCAFIVVSFSAPTAEFRCAEDWRKSRMGAVPYAPHAHNRSYASHVDGTKGRRKSIGMAISVVRLGSKRARGEGLRLGTVRRPPRGVPKARFAQDDWYDVWFPTLAPTVPTMKLALRATTARQHAQFRRQFLAEMKKADASRALDLLAGLSHSANFSIGCYCEDEARCHRSLLRELLEKRGARFNG